MPKKRKITSSAPLIILLAILAGTLLTWKLVFAPRRKTPAPTPTPTPITKKSQFSLPSPAISPLISAPTTTLTPGEKKVGQGDSPEELRRSLLEKFPLFDSVPHKTNDFSLDYKAPLHLEVKIKTGADTATVEEEVNDWLWSKGVNPSTHQIDWITP